MNQAGAARHNTQSNMTTNTAYNRMAVAGLLTKKGEINATYRIIFDQLAAGVDKFRPCHWRGSRRHLTLQDDGYNIRRVFNVLRLSYTEGNDAPRGGREGDFIELTAAARRALAPVRADFAACDK